MGERRDEWPGSGESVRRVAREFLGKGEGRQAAVALMAALKNLGEFYVDEDEDTDFGWHRSEGKTWERWAYCRALREVLVESDPEVEWRGEILAELGRLLKGAKASSGWLSLEFFLPLAPADVARIGGEALGQEDGHEWVAPEEALARRVLEGQGELERKELEELIDEYVYADVFDEAEAVMERLYLYRRVAERLVAMGEGKAAGFVAYEGLAFQRIEFAEFVVNRSERSEAVALEEAKLLETVANEFGSPEQAETVIDGLTDEEYEALYGSYGMKRRQVKKLLAAEEVKAAFLEAKEYFEKEPKNVRFELKDVAQWFVDRGHLELAARLLAPHTEEYYEIAELYAETLSALKSPEVGEAFLDWFAMRPVLKTYQRIAELCDEERWLQVRKDLLEHLERAKLFVVIVDIAVEERDVEALERVIPKLDGMFLDHARGRVTPLLDALSPETRRRLGKR